MFAIVIFAFAVLQYRRGETWKKSEFIAKLYKDFMDDVSCQRAMWMLDWINRPIDFGTEKNPFVVKYNHQILMTALRKHDGNPFNDEEIVIRDAFDRFFVYIEQFERAIQNKLVHQEQVYPYFGYWIGLLSGQLHLPNEIRLVVLNYIECYEFDDVKRFLNRWSKR